MKRQKEKFTPAPPEDIAVLRKIIIAMRTTEYMLGPDATMTVRLGAVDSPIRTATVNIGPVEPTENRHQRRTAKHYAERKTARQPKGFRPKKGTP